MRWKNFVLLPQHDVSPRTIGAHLRSIFRKLGITSRRQIKELLLHDASARRSH